MKNQSGKTVLLYKVILTGTLMLACAQANAAEQVLCMKASHAPVYENNMTVFAFSGVRFEKVVPFQGWGENEKLVGDKKYIRAQFPDRTDDTNDIGWVSAALVKNKSECEGVEQAPVITKVNMSAQIQAPAASVGGLLDPNCCRFPLASSAKADYTTGMRQFGWGRKVSGGGIRKHAASDLWHREYEPVYAVADGVILRDRSPGFTKLTASTEIRHAGGFIGRYCEIASSTQKRGLVLGVGKKVKKGDLIGYIKNTGSTAPSPMLHFELYKGTLQGSLSGSCAGNSFCRRADLVNSAPHLKKWESSL